METNGSKDKVNENMDKKFKELKIKLDKLKKEILKKFQKEVVGIALMPPPKPPMIKNGIPNEVIELEKKEYEKNKNLMYVLVFVNDKDIKKKWELKERVSKEISKIAKEIDEKIKVNTLILDELIENCYDGKYELLELISMSLSIYDPSDFIAAIRVAEVHKTMVLKKFEKYVVSYVAAGSLFRGEKSNDIDVYVVVDDTDVKKMPRIELKDKLGAIIRGMGTEASMITHVKKQFHDQIYILTDFWESVKDAQPVIFTFLRDGVPLFDRGVFMPWKLLLSMGRIRPSPEAIDMNMNIGGRMLERAKFKLLSAIADDIYYATLNPSQAALMLYGVNPPTPKETIELLDKIFVVKEKILEKKYVNILEKIRKFYKDIEHKKIKEVKGKDVDMLINEAEDYLKRIRKLFDEIRVTKERENFNEVHDSSLKIVKEVLGIKGKVSNESLIKKFNSELVIKKKIGKSYLEILKSVIKAKKELKKLSSQEIEKVGRESRILIRVLFELIQKKKGLELERNRIRVKYGDKISEVLLLDKIVFISKDKEVSKADINEDGSLKNISISSLEELEKYLETNKLPKQTFIKEKTFESLKKMFGKDIEVMVGF